MAQDKDMEHASSSGGGQSKRPPLSRQHSEVGDAQHRPKQHQKQHHVRHVHSRVPSSKALHKQHAQAHANQPAASGKTTGNSTSARRAASPPESVTPQQRSLSSTLQSHKRATSEVKLPRHPSSPAIQKSASQSSIKRNRSQGEIHKRTRSTDKLKRHSGGTATHRPRSSKSQVHFDLGSDGQDEEEWVDASGSNSPHLSRKGSINSSVQSSLRPAPTGANSRPDTPLEDVQQEHSTPDRERVHHKEYLTTRLLQRTPSHGAPPQITSDMAQADQTKISSDSSGHDTPSSTLPGSSKDGLTSRFVNTPGSGITSEGSFYRPETSNGPEPEEPTRSVKSTTSLSQPRNTPELAQIIDDRDDSALVPKPARRVAGKPAEQSRIQQKLNLQRASSAIEPGHNVPSATGNIGSSALIGVGGPGYDGASSRDPRMSKLLERTGMEYLVVRRYQNPVARSLTRLGRVPEIEKTRRIPRINTGSTNNKRSMDSATRHVRNVSTGDPRRPITPRNTTSIRTNGGSSFEGEDDNRLNERLSGSSLVGGEDDDGTAAILRSLWEKSMDLSASGD